MIHNIQLFQNVDWDTSVKAYVNSSPPKDGQLWRRLLTAILQVWRHLWFFSLENSV
jgi:hypothetical protein